MSAIPAPGRRRPARPRRRGATPARPVRPVARSRTFGRAASLPSYLGVAVVGLLLGAIVTLQIGALRANIEAGKVDAQRRAVLVDVVNQRAALARQFPRSRVDAAAAQLGMVLPGPEAYQQIRIRNPR